MLQEIGQRTLKKSGSTNLYAIDHMDDGSSINLNVQIDLNEVCIVYKLLLSYLALCPRGSCKLINKYLTLSTLKYFCKKHLLFHISNHHNFLS